MKLNKYCTLKKEYPKSFVLFPSVLTRFAMSLSFFVWTSDREYGLLTGH